jgi:hypothetical protein
MDDEVLFIGVVAMNAPSVYIETSVPSAYATTRSDPGSVHRRTLTRDWWRDQLRLYDVWTSDAVLVELANDDWPGKADAIALIDPLPRLEINEDVVAVAGRYIAERLVPADLSGDAVHLAAASVHEMDFLLTWNIRHLANPNKMEHLTVINRRLRLLTPAVVTPEMLWLEE